MAAPSILCDSWLAGRHLCNSYYRWIQIWRYRSVHCSCLLSDSCHIKIKYGYVNFLVNICITAHDRTVDIPVTLGSWLLRLHKMGCQNIWQSQWWWLWFCGSTNAFTAQISWLLEVRGKKKDLKDDSEILYKELSTLILAVNVQLYDITMVTSLVLLFCLI